MLDHHTQECEMISRDLQRLDAPDRERWQTGCKNRLTPACEEQTIAGLQE